MPYQSLPQRILSLAFPTLLSDLVSRRKQGKSWRLKKRPDVPFVVVIDTIRNAQRIVCHETLAASAGIRIDQTLSDARALVPDIDVHLFDPAVRQAGLTNIAKWCSRYTPLTAISGEDGLFLDITGCAHLFGGEQALLEDLQSALTAQGFENRAGIADTPGAGWAVARFGQDQIIASGDHQRALLDMPLACLRLARGQETELNRVGLKTVGCIAGMPRAPLAARFGKQLLNRLDQAFGHQEEAISPLLPVAELVSEKRFASPIVHEDDVCRTIRLLAENIRPCLEQRGVGARACKIQLFRTDGEVLSLEIETAAPTREPARITALFSERLATLHDGWDAGFGFDIMQLCICRTAPFHETQGLLTEDGGAPEKLEHLIERLSTRLGAQAVGVFQLENSHIPERRFKLAPAIHTSPAQPLLPEVPPDNVTRPLLLLSQPEPVQTIAEVPEGPPIRFRWRRVLYEIEKTEGPERLACEWWKDGRGAFSRDYFRVEDNNGYRFWLFRDGLFGRETPSPTWYMHGMFA